MWLDTELVARLITTVAKAIDGYIRVCDECGNNSESRTVLDNYKLYGARLVAMYTLSLRDRLLRVTRSFEGLEEVYGAATESLAEFAGREATSWHSLVLILAHESVNKVFTACRVLDHGVDFEKSIPNLKSLSLDDLHDRMREAGSELESSLRQIELPPVTDLRFWHVRLEKELFRVSLDDTTRETPQSGQHVTVDHGGSKIFVDEVSHDAELEWCSIVQSLIDASGDYVTGPEMRSLRGCRGKKIWKVVQELEEAIPTIKPYLRHEGNKGYRLLNG
jgi:biotin operon repressor